MQIPTPMRLTACALAAGALAVPASSAIAASSAKNVKISNCDKALVRPKSVTLTCGDGNVALTKLSWSSFGGSSAKATGKIEINGCEPDCAAGKTKSYPVKVVASKPRSCRRGLSVYVYVAVTFTGAKPSNAREFTHDTLACPS